MGKNPETRLQFVVVKFMHQVLPKDTLFWHCPNGGKMSEAWRKMLAGLGVLPGASDLMMIQDGKFYAIELKVEKNELFGIKNTTYQSPQQVQFEARVKAAGGFYAVVRSVDDLRVQLKEWKIRTREKVQ